MMLGTRAYMGSLDRCFKKVIDNIGPQQDTGPCNRFRYAHPDVGHEFEEGSPPSDVEYAYTLQDENGIEYANGVPAESGGK
jgi:hypothetical protein